jgi:hypothetical protein
VIPVGEWMHGAYKSLRVDGNLTRLGVLLTAVTILSYDEAATRWS